MDMNDFMKKAQEAQQQMQEQLKAAQERLEKLEITGEAGAGMVTVTINGKREVKKVTFDEPQVKALLADNNLEVLADLFAAAMNNANQKFEREQQKHMKAMTANMKLPKDLDLGDLFKGGDKS